MANGDFNVDGKTDLVVGASSVKKAYIFYNDGSISTTAASADKIITNANASFGQSLVSADFNMDSKIDLAVGSSEKFFIYLTEATSGVFNTVRVKGNATTIKGSVKIK
jgi:hypothetical protein